MYIYNYICVHMRYGTSHNKRSMYIYIYIWHTLRFSKHNTCRSWSITKEKARIGNEWDVAKKSLLKSLLKRIRRSRWQETWHWLHSVPHPKPKVHQGSPQHPGAIDSMDFTSLKLWWLSEDIVVAPWVCPWLIITCNIYMYIYITCQKKISITTPSWITMK